MLHGKHSFGKAISEVWCQACDLMRFIQLTHTYILHQTYEYHQFSSIYLSKWEERLVFRLSLVYLQRAKDGTHMCHLSHAEGKQVIVEKPKVFSFWEINATKFGAKIWFRLDCIMQLKQPYYIATNVCSRKSATTFGDLSDWSMCI